MKNISIASILLLFSFQLHSQFTNLFENTSSVDVNYSFSSDSIIPLNNFKVGLNSIRITGTVILNDEPAFIRIILLDQDSIEYLIYETGTEYAQSKEIQLKDIGYETSILTNVIFPKDFIFQINNASINTIVR